VWWFLQATKFRLGWLAFLLRSLFRDPCLFPDLVRDLVLCLALKVTLVWLECLPGKLPPVLLPPFSFS